MEWRANQITNSTKGMHCDTCGGSTIEGNFIENVDQWGILAETGSDNAISGNEVRNTGLTTPTTAIAIGGQGTPASLKTQVNALDATTGLTASPNVTLALDTGDKQEGTGSVQATIAAAFTTGIIFYQDHGSVNGNWENPYREIWIKTDMALASGMLSLATTGSLNCASFAAADGGQTHKLPWLPANTWVRLSMYFPRWHYDISAYRGIRCWAVVANSDPGAVVVKFDDLAATRRVTGNVVAHNRVVLPNGPCYDFGNMTGGEIRGNYCEDPEFQSGTVRRAYTFEYATNPIAIGNDVRFTAKTATQAGQFWVLDAGSTVIDMGNRGTSVDTYASVAAGGKLLRATPDPAGDTWIFDGAANSHIQVKSTNSGTPTAYMQAGNPATFGTLTNHDMRFAPNQTEQARISAASGDLTLNQNLKIKSGTSFAVTLDHAATADRTVAIPDFGGTLAMLERAQAFTAPQDVNAVFRATAAAYVAPASGAGVEIDYRTGTDEGFVTSYNRT
ncbi:MAG: hypothetical protein ACREUU_13085, partial [Gammaproteobacteria bacterium]